MRLWGLPSVDEPDRGVDHPLAVETPRSVPTRAREEILTGAEPGDLAARARDEPAFSCATVQRQRSQGHLSGHALLRPAAVAGALLVSLAPAGALAAAPTKQERWIAFRAGRPASGVHVVRRGRGYCFTGSLADPRTDAWRCLLGNEIQDPCFSGGGAFVVCPDGTPDSRDALRLQLTKPLPHNHANPPGDPTHKDPWVIVTAGGAYCYRVTGTTTVAAGRALTYECAGAAALAGSPNRAQQAWTISMLSTSASKRYVTTAIASVWW